MEENYVVKGRPITEKVSADNVGLRIYQTLDNHAMIDKLVLRNESCDIDMSAGELLLNSCKMAQWFRDNGLKKNDVISIYSENHINFFIPVLGALYNGIIVTPINVGYSARELHHIFNIASPTVLFCSLQGYERIITLYRRKEIKFVKKIIILDHIKQFLADVKIDKTFCPVEVDSKEDIAVILYSSGTTGLPKGVMVTHYNLNVRHIHACDPNFTLEESALRLTFVPFCHAMGLVNNLSNLITGVPIVFLVRFELETFLRSIEKYKPKSVGIVPPIAVLLVKSPLVDKYDLSSLVEIWCGAACLSKNIEEALIKRLKLKSIRQVYGLTETTLGATAIPLNATLHPGASGQPYPGVEIKICDTNTSRALPFGEQGEIYIRAGTVTKGYYKTPEATKECYLPNGWLRTGDIGYLDKDGFIYIVDRLKELIKYKAYQVPPAELEAILLTHSGIADAAVIGLPDEDAGELPIAFVVRKTDLIGDALNEKEVQEFVATQVSSQKKLRGGVLFISAIPKNPSGKILRRILRDMLKPIKHLSKI